MLKKYFFVFVVFVPFIVQAQLFVGNGGEAIQTEEGLYLRDLYEQELHHSPFFAENLDAKILQQIYKTKVLHPESALGKALDAKALNLLSYKLIELNRYHPYLADYTLAAMDKYKWVFTDEELILMPDDAPIFVRQPHQRVQVANRFLNTIRIHRPSWNRLNSAHKVALVIHEVFYSFSRPVCASETRCEPLSRVLRELVAQFFDHPSRHNYQLSKIMRLSLALPSGVENCPHDSEGFILTIVDKTLQKKLLTRAYSENLWDVVERHKNIARFCEDYSFWLKKWQAPIFVNLDMHRKPYLLKEDIYLSHFREQVTWVFEPYSPVIQLSLTFQTQVECEDQLQEHLRLWFRWKSFNASDSQRSTCLN